MSTLKLSDHIYSVGVINPSLRVFDIIMKAEYGTTYNSYLIKADKTVLIDTVHRTFFEEYLSNLLEITPIEEIDYIIVNHCEPDHTGSIVRLLELNPNIKLISTAAGSKYLANITNLPLNIQIVKMGDALDLGDRALQFIPAPFLHWPDSMFTYDPVSKIVFTCDFLGEHYCESSILDENIHYPEKFASSFRYYFNCIFGPFKPYVLEGLKKLEVLDIRKVAPSHGFILEKRLAQAMEQYRLWSAPPVKKEKKTMVIAHASAYGYTERMAETAADAVRSIGFDVELLDIVKTDPLEIADKINSCDALLIGSNTINRDATRPVWDVLSSIDGINNTKKPAGAFGSFGWSGEAVGMIKDRLCALRFHFVGDGLRIPFYPDKSDLKSVADYAVEVANSCK